MENFEFKSAVCTSVEQSKRLLKLGLKKETADCYLFEYDKEKYKVIAESWLDLIEDKKYHSQYKDVCFPAWSLHRLLLLLNCAYVELDANNPFEDCITRIEFLIKESKIFNKDYLEEK